MNLLHCVVILLAIAFFYSSPKREEQRWIYICMCLVLLFCSCFRSVTVGVDTQTYASFFQRTRELSLSECLEWPFESGYIILNKVISTFTGNTQVFLAVMSLFILVPVFWLTWTRSVNPLLSLLVFVVVGNWYSSFAALRQWCAVAILVWGYSCIVKRRLIPFLVIVSLAYTFHQSALFVLPLYILYPMKVSQPKVLICACLAVICLVFQDYIMGILNLFARLDTEIKAGGGAVLLFTLWALVIIIDMFAYPTENERDMKLNYMAILYSATIQPLSLKYGPFARIHLYCWFGMEFGIPRLMQFMDRNNARSNSYMLKFAVTVVLVIWYAVTVDEKTLILAI